MAFFPHLCGLHPPLRPIVQPRQHPLHLGHVLGTFFERVQELGEGDGPGAAVADGAVQGAGEERALDLEEKK